MRWCGSGSIWEISAAKAGLNRWPNLEPGTSNNPLPAAEREASRFVFRWNGELWEVVFDRLGPFCLENTLGAKYLDQANQPLEEKPSRIGKSALPTIRVTTDMKTMNKPPNAISEARASMPHISLSAFGGEGWGEAPRSRCCRGLRSRWGPSLRTWLAGRGGCRGRQRA